MSPHAPEMQEQRSHGRLTVRLPLDFLLVGNTLAGVSTFSSETLDMGAGGAKIRVPAALASGQRLGLSMHLPDGTRHQCRARVLRSSPLPEREGDLGAWAAVEFVEAPFELRTAITALIASAANAEST